MYTYKLIKDISCLISIAYMLLVKQFFSTSVLKNDVLDSPRQIITVLMFKKFSLFFHSHLIN